jgi:hypothetical protein
MQTQQPGSSLAKVEVVSVLGFACVLRLYSCSALHSYNRKRISFPAPKGTRSPLNTDLVSDNTEWCVDNVTIRGYVCSQTRPTAR